MKTALTTFITLALASFARAVPAAVPVASYVPGSFAAHQRPSVIHQQGPSSAIRHNDPGPMVSYTHSSDRRSRYGGGYINTRHLESRVTSATAHAIVRDNEESVQSDTPRSNQERAISTSFDDGLPTQPGSISKLPVHEALASGTDRKQHAWNGRGVTHGTSPLSRGKHHEAQAISNISIRRSAPGVAAFAHTPAASALLSRLLGVISQGPKSTTQAIQPKLVHSDGITNIRRDEVDDTTDIQYLNYILILEQFQYAFYTRALSRLSGDDFRNARHPDWVRARFIEIAENERIHKEFLESSITAAGSDHVQPENYNFHNYDVQSFIDTSMAIETISASAYIGLLQFLTNKAYVTAEASMLADRARQAAWINSSVRKQNAWNTGFESPLTPNQVITLLGSFLNYEALLKSNRVLLPANFHPYPRLTLSPRLVPGEQAEISFPYSPPPGGNFEILVVAFLSGAETIFSRVLEREERTLEGSEGLKRYFVEIPVDLASRGAVYATVLRGRNVDMSDISLDEDNVVAGPAIAMFAFDAKSNSI